MILGRSARKTLTTAGDPSSVGGKQVRKNRNLENKKGIAMNESIFGATICGIGRAREGLFVQTNDEINTFLKERIPCLRKWWYSSEGRLWWDSPGADPVRERLARHWQKYVKNSGRPSSLTDIRKITSDSGYYYDLFERAAVVELETSDTWIAEHTGIRQREFVKQGVATSDLAVEAAREALTTAGLSPADVDGIYLATVSPDHPQTPPTTCLIQKKLDIPTVNNGSIRHIDFLDGSDACSSFIVVLRNAYRAIRNGEVNVALVIGADVMTSTMSIFSRNLWPILADGAGALVLKRVPKEEDCFSPNGFFSHCDGGFAPLIVTPAGGSRLAVTEAMIANPFDQRHKMSMDGPAVRKRAVYVLWGRNQNEWRQAVIPRALEHAGFDVSSPEGLKQALNTINVPLLHQANGVITDHIEEKFVEYGYELNPEADDAAVRRTFFDNIAWHGNTTSASIPLLLYEAWQRKILIPGMEVFAIVFGGGFTAATSKFRWELPYIELEKAV